MGPGRWTRSFVPHRQNKDSPQACVPAPAGGAGSPRPWSVAASPCLLGGSCRSSRWLALWGSSHSACWSQSVSSVTWRGGASVGSGTQVQHPFAPHPPAVQSDRVAGFPGPRPAAVSLGGGHTVSHPARRGQSLLHAEVSHSCAPSVHAEEDTREPPMLRGTASRDKSHTDRFHKMPTCVTVQSHRCCRVGGH